MSAIAIFASGSGTNAQQFFDYYCQHPFARVELLLCNNPNAHVIERASNANIEVLVFTNSCLKETTTVYNKLKEKNIDFIVLAGFMKLVPKQIINEWEGRIVNIHPALLPKYGGKGMYGEHVHNAVLNSGDTKSGITIHYVNEMYDEGDIIFQAECPVFPDDTADTLAQRIHKLEHQHYPHIVESLIKKKYKNIDYR